jgi:peptide/nickel transport system substrate-binding protein
MAMAIDREGLTNAITFGNGVPANSLLPSTLDYYDPNITPPAYDPEGARALLEEAGAVGAEIEFLADTTDQGGQLIQDQLNQVGLNVKINQVDSGGWWDKLVGADYGATLTWWYNEVPDPDTAVRWALCGSCGNDSYYTYYNSPEVNELTERALHETDAEARASLYSQIQQISMEDVAQIPVYYQPYQNVYRSWVRDLHMNPAIQWNLDEAWKDQ